VFFVGFKGDTRDVRKEGNSKLIVPAANAADAAIIDRLKEKVGGQQTMAR
jgi:hypothetical protein